MVRVMLLSACREEVASCSERAYDSLRVSEAQRLLMLNSDKAVLDLAAQVRAQRIDANHQMHGWRQTTMPCAAMAVPLLPCCTPQRGWRVEGGRILFSHSGENGKAEKEVPPMILIQNALVYAKELERIV